MVQIPIEICGIICHDSTLSPGDLWALTTVSRSFHGEAERQLYSDVSISDPRFIKGWCLTIARKGYLSPRVKALKIVFPPSRDLEEADHRRIAKSLRACVNLQTLGVHNDGRTSPGDSIQTWIIENHPFKLLHFTNDYFNSTYLNNFYTQHPGIRTLSSPIFHILYRTQTALPNLTTLNVPANFLERAIGPGWDNHKHIRNIQYALHGNGDEMASIQALSRFKETLTSVSINRIEKRPQRGFQDIIARVVSAAPGVKFLRITDELPSAFVYVHPQPMDIVSDYLKAVVIKIITPKSFPNINPPHETVLNFGIFDTPLPMAQSLEHVTVILGKNYRYSRELDGRLVYIGEVDVDDSEWMAG